LCFDQEGAKAVGGLIAPADYDVYFRDIAEGANDYRNEFKKVPGEHTLDIIENLIEKRPKSKDIYRHLWESIQTTRTGINREYVVKQAAAFARRQRVKRGIQQGVEILQQNTDESIDRAEMVLRDAFKLKDNFFDPGVTLTDYNHSLSFLDESEDETIPWGVREFDAVGICPQRKATFLIMALTNKGKTWGAIHCGKTAIRHRKRVCHITNEMSERRIAQRYIQAIFSISRREAEFVNRLLKKDDMGKFVECKEIEVKNRRHLQQANIRPYLIKKLKQLRQRTPPLVIKQFPTGSLTMDGLRRYLDSLEALSKFIPDELIIDSPDLMSHDMKHLRESSIILHREIRGLCMERNMAGVATTQAHRAAHNVRVLDVHNVGEDWSKMQTADIGITYNQTGSEEKMNLARLFAARVRDEQKHMMIMISQQYGLGQFCLDSAKMSESYWDEVEGEDESED
jgi:replicative DNA helicase